MNIKRNLFKTIMLSVLFVSASQFASAQMPDQFETATINSDYCVTIDVSKPVAEYYKIDISALNFANQTDAQKVFGAISNNYLTYRVDFPNQLAYLHIHLDRTPEPKDVLWWNNYLQDLCNH